MGLAWAFVKQLIFQGSFVGGLILFDSKRRADSLLRLPLYIGSSLCQLKLPLYTLHSMVLIRTPGEQVLRNLFFAMVYGSRTLTVPPRFRPPFDSLVLTSPSRGVSLVQSPLGVWTHNSMDLTTILYCWISVLVSNWSRHTTLGQSQMECFHVFPSSLDIYRPVDLCRLLLAASGLPGPHLDILLVQVVF